MIGLQRKTAAQGRRRLIVAVLLHQHGGEIEQGKGVVLKVGQGRPKMAERVLVAPLAMAQQTQKIAHMGRRGSGFPGPRQQTLGLRELTRGKRPLRLRQEAAEFGRALLGHAPRPLSPIDRR